MSATEVTGPGAVIPLWVALGPGVMIGVSVLHAVTLTVEQAMDACQADSTAPLDWVEDDITHRFRAGTIRQGRWELIPTELMVPDIMAVIRGLPGELQDEIRDRLTKLADLDYEGPSMETIAGLHPADRAALGLYPQPSDVSYDEDSRWVQDHGHTGLLVGDVCTECDRLVASDPQFAALVGVVHNADGSRVEGAGDG